MLRLAYDMELDTLERRRRVLGADHPDTLRSAYNVAASLHELGEYIRANDITRTVLQRRRQIFGDDHPAHSTPDTAWHSPTSKRGRSCRPGA